ncbi:TVP38/TMEM64 family protein [Desulfosporosinus orientis]|uniref:TVP38/TMEM64 family protein n=1 Tax=Desulfosporosinus orientis TaxID=1563 RepID=UPI001575289D|nr:TVP38/TMEM64 family protein [Desulfosporosinus orientis]
MNKRTFSLITWLLSLSLIVLLYPKLQDPTEIQNLITQWKWLSVCIDLSILTLLALFPIIPFVLMAGINTLIFGWVGGFLVSLCGSLLGASLGFWLARTLGQAWVQPKIGKLGKWGTLIESNSFSITLISRLIPILPAAAVNYAAGLSAMSFPKFLVASIIGKIPMIIWESWAGHDFWNLSESPSRFFLALVIGIVIFGLAGFLGYSSVKGFKDTSM